MFRIMKMIKRAGICSNGLSVWKIRSNRVDFTGWTSINKLKYKDRKLNGTWCQWCVKVVILCKLSLCQSLECQFSLLITFTAKLKAKGQKAFVIHLHC